MVDDPEFTIKAPETERAVVEAFVIVPLVIVPVTMFRLLIVEEAAFTIKPPVA